MSSDIESIGRGDHVAKIWVWLKSLSDTLGAVSDGPPHVYESAVYFGFVLRETCSIGQSMVPSLSLT
jgi:hypothetical protein